MIRRTVTGYVDPATGEWLELVDPDGSPSWRQLRKLNELGMLELVAPCEADPITKGEASHAIATAAAARLLERQERRRDRYDRVCRAIVAHVVDDPGCSSSDVCRAVHAAGWTYVEARVRDLLAFAVLVDARQGRGRRELYANDAAAAAGRGTP